MTQVLQEELERIFIFNNKEVKVKKKIPTYEKQAIIDVALAESAKDNGTISRLIYDAVVYVLIALKYSDYDISDYKETKIVELYDKLEKEGFIRQVVSYIDSEEFNCLLQYVDLAYEQATKRLNSAAASVEAILNTLVAMGALEKAKNNK